MGNDGGSIPRREELVKLRKRISEIAEKDEANRVKWKLCKLSEQPLYPPVVACPLGYLYNKSAVLEALLEKKLPPAFSHIKKVKDLIQVNLHEIPSNSDEKNYVCPISKKELGGNYKFLLLRECGCVISQTAFNEIHDSSEFCPNCSKPISNSKFSIIPLNGTAEEVAELRENLQAEKKEHKKTRSEKSKKRKKITTTEEVSAKKRKTGPKSLISTMVATSDPLKLMPAQADPEIYKSLFTSSINTAEGETFCCRNASHRLC